MSTYYQIESGTAPWGDYGYTLWNGFTEKNQERGQPTIVVSRTGPFVPPIMVLFGPVLVTEDFRQRLLLENFSGLSFVPVGYRKVVRIPWDQWDANAREPAFYPDSGEPEDYLLEGAHDQELAKPCRDFGRGKSRPQQDCKFKVATPFVEIFTPAPMSLGSTTSSGSANE